MTMISYAQHGEDVVLARAFGERGSGVYVDVGAHHPTDSSVTRHFYERGWSGVNLEPNPRLFARFPEARPRDVNLPIGVSDTPGRLTFFEFPEHTGLSTFDEREASVHRAAGKPVVVRQIEVDTLDAVIDRTLAGRAIDFISIDVEGHEGAVLRGLDLRRHRPTVLVIEAVRPLTHDPSHEWETQVLSGGYRLALFDGLNRFYVREEDAHLLPALAAPASPADDFVPWHYERRIRELERRLARLRGVEQAVERVGRLTSWLTGRRA